MKSLELDRRSMLWISAGAVVGTCAGCPARPAPQPAADKATAKLKPLAVLVADDPPLAEAIGREWRGRTEQELVVRQVALDELAGASRLPADAVVFPPGHIGQFAERGLIVPLENEALEEADFNYRDIFDLIRLREMRWGGRTMAAPLGSPQLLLCYRADVFEKLGLSPPRDWDEYQQAVLRLSDRAAIGDLAADDQAWQATIEPLAEGWAGQVLLARAAGYAMHRDQVSPLFQFGTMEALIDQPPYVRALEELVVAVKAAGGEQSRQSPAEAFAALMGGQCGMTLAWPTAGSSAERVAGRFAFATLPAGRQAYRFATGSWENRGVEDIGPVPLLAAAGRMAAVSASSQDATRASGLVIWLANRDASEHVAPHSAAATLFRRSQVAQSSRWTPQVSPEESRQYAEVLAATLTSPRPMPGVTLPGRADYLMALDKAVHEAVDGKTAAEALAEAAHRWRKITDKLGVEAQRRALGHALGQASP